MIMTINIKITGGEEGVKENSDQTLEPESPLHPAPTQVPAQAQEMIALLPGLR